MAKRCPKCGTMNDDELVFCGACTEPLNADVRLVMRVDEMAKEMRSHEDRPAERERERDHAPTGARTVHEEDARKLNIQKKEDKKSGGALPMILLGLVAAAAVIFLMK